jgi:agmatinase
MLSEPQIAATRRAIYPAGAPALPVSPLSIAERALDLVFALNPGVAPFILGGDHSVAWPAAAAIARAPRDRWGIVQPDAHTDLLAERLGVKYCFATWSYHANELLGGSGRMVQVGVRASGKDRGHWEATTGVRQFWAAECRDRPAETIDAVIDHLRSAGVRSVYFSNDIDGTDEEFASGDRHPEPRGLDPEWHPRAHRPAQAATSASSAATSSRSRRRWARPPRPPAAPSISPPATSAPPSPPPSEGYRGASGSS